MKKYLKNLEHIGLNKNQARVYLAALDLGPSTVIQLSNHTDIIRTTVYDNLRALKQFGLIAENIENGKKLFTAESPEKLSNILERQKQTIEDIIPELKNIFNSPKSKPKIQFLHGYEGVKKIIEMSYKDNPTRKIYILGDLNTGLSWLNEKERLPYKKERIKRAIRTCIISTNTYEEVKKFSHNDPKKHQRDMRDVRLAPKNLKIPIYFKIFGNKVALLSSDKEGYSMIVDSPEFTASFKSIFNFLWQLSKPFKI